LTTVSAITFWLQREWGQLAASASILLSAIVDAHVAIGALLTTAGSPLPNTAAPALVPTLLLCLTINSVTKATVTFAAAGRSRYSMQVSLALSAIVIVPWLVWWFA
jgi:CDP-diglyceride synthetase